MMMRRGFSLVELVSVVVVVASVGAVLGPSVGRVQNQSKMLTSEGNLRRIGQMSGMYALDHNDQIFSFSWKGGETYTNLANGKSFVPNSDQNAASYQVRDILYRLTGRVSGQTRIAAPLVRLMHRRYSHLVLADYIGEVPGSVWVDPADASLLSWQQNPLEFFEDDNSLPYGNGFPMEKGYDSDSNWANPTITQLWAFGSSYHQVPHSYIPDIRATYYPVSYSPHVYTSTGSEPALVQRYFHEVAFPLAKVFMFEEFDREQAGDPYFAYDHARPAKLMFDGAVNTMMSGDAWSAYNPGSFSREDRFHCTTWSQKYVPLDQFPVPLGGLGDETLLDMRYRWTSYGLQGVDYFLEREGCD